ncbi:hypothetical protein [Limosilactobacillus fermentum]|uniref:hypothetical protein n=1 Tax=Limosilactobacillus fermentum TaxID=1613 RepID=UPI003D77A6E6
MARKSIAERLAALKEQERKLHQEADRELVKAAHKVGIMSAEDMPTKQEMEQLKKHRNYLANQTTDQTYDRESEN